jgi:hypothetical protein
MQPGHLNSTVPLNTDNTPHRFGAFCVSPNDLSGHALDGMRVHENIQSMITSFLTALDIPESSVIRPVVSLDPSIETSCFNGGTNAIHIAIHHYGKMDVYGEEVVHWLREQVKPQQKSGMLALTEDRQMAVDEFFGHLGFCLARQVCLSPELSELTNSYPMELVPDMVRTYRLGMETIEKKLTELRTFCESDRAVELRSIATNLLFLHKRLNNSDNDGMAALRFWGDLFNDTITKAVAAPLLPDTLGDQVFIADSRLRNSLTTLVSQITSAITQKGNNAGPIRDEESAPERNCLKAIGEAAKGRSEKISRVFGIFEELQRQFEKELRSLIDHCDGYEAAAVFLRNSKNPIEDVKVLITTPCRKVFFKHVFGAHLDAKHRPSSLSEWKEALRIGLRYPMSERA